MLNTKQKNIQQSQVHNSAQTIIIQNFKYNKQPLQNKSKFEVYRFKKLRPYVSTCLNIKVNYHIQPLFFLCVLVQKQKKTNL